MHSQIYPSHVFNVRPVLPPELAALHELAYNLWWSWNPAARALFRRLDPDLFGATLHNPVAFLAAVAPDRLEAKARDDEYLSDLARVHQRFRRYLEADTWFRQAHPDAGDMRAAYVSMEFGVSEAVPLYSGGLGVLAGDHIKAASDLGVPIVGVGMLYRHGYFHQWLDPAGQQRERFSPNDVHSLPVVALEDEAGDPRTVAVRLDGREVFARLWRMDVGRVPIVLLDANVPQNEPEDRNLTDKLYQGDVTVRLRQEALLGIGGMRALEALDLAPTIVHLNEGHSAFLVLERVRAIRERTGLELPAALEAVRAGTVFTTHTPVPAGHDEFTTDQIDRHLAPYLQELGMTPDDLMRLGRVDPHAQEEPLGVTVLALRASAWRNAVSELHGRVSRDMWRRLWPDVPVDDVPIGHITNGVHLRTWVSGELAELFDRYVGPDWEDPLHAKDVVEGIRMIPASEFWRVHVRRRERLVRSIRLRRWRQIERARGSDAELREAGAVLDPQVLTIGFARRFALYKRPTLVLNDIDRLRTILTDAARPAQIIFAGKAHPNDQLAKDMVREITAIARDPAFGGRLVFVEDYDMSLARDLVQGCDVWLNTPVPPQEASGTSGMKSAANGGLNLSVLDGWWAEAYTPEAGWTFGGEESGDYGPERDAGDAATLYNLLERSVAPLFYDRDEHGMPAAWIRKSNAAMRLAVTSFGTGRMVREYVDRLYLPAHELAGCLIPDGGARADTLAAWLRGIRACWSDVRVLEVAVDAGADHGVGAELPVRVRVGLNGLGPSDVTVGVSVGPLDHLGALMAARTIAASSEGEGPDGSHWFRAPVRLDRSGRLGVAARIVPRHPDLADVLGTGLIRWSEPARLA